MTTVRPATPDVHIVSMAHVLLGNVAVDSGGVDQESFEKGYKRGFEHGWAVGFHQGWNDAANGELAESEDGAGNAAAEGGGAAPSGYTPSPGHREMCLLTDVPVVEDPADTSPIRDEDVFDDAKSTISAADFAESDLIDVFYIAKSHISASDRGEDNAGLSDLLDLSYDADKSIYEASPIPNKTNKSSKTVVDSAQPESSGDTHMSPDQEGVLLFLDEPSAPIAGETNNHNTTGGTALVPPQAQLLETTPSTSTTDPASPQIMTLTPEPENGDTTPDPKRSTLYNIPLAHTIRPITPDLSTPPSAKRPRPAYPALAAPFNVYTLRAEGLTVSEDPWRVLIGPLSASARVAWSGDKGKGYLRSKLTPGSRIRGGGGSYRGGRGGYRGVGGGRGWNAHAREDESPSCGLVFCEMISDEEGVWYIVATFETQKHAREAVRTFTGYACGGSIMWAWIYQEQE